MHGLTLFSTPKDFDGPYDAIQRNAISSWLEMNANVMLLVKPGTDVSQVAKTFGLPSYEIAVNKYGTPMVNSIFCAGFAYADTPLTCYINADIIVLGPLDRAAAICAERFERFLMVGQRMDLDLQGIRLDFGGDWREELRQMVADHGVLHAACGIDYFCSTKNVWGDIPPFALGRAAWDNWLVAAPLRRSVPVVDATQYVTVVHQAHPRMPNERERPESKDNYRILRDMGDGSGSVIQTPWVLIDSEIHKR